MQNIWEKVPLDYYQKGVQKNILQNLWHRGKIKVTENLLIGVKVQKLLDVGCASGWFLSQIAKKHRKAKFSGIDIYKEAIIYGKKKI